MSRVLRVSLLVLTALPLLLAGCGEDPAETPSGTPIKQLTAAGTCPIEVSEIARTLGPLPAFRATLKNLSSSPVSAVSWTAVFVDPEGKPVGKPVDGGYADPLSPISPGASIEGHLPAPAHAVHTVRLAIKSLIYRIPNPVTPDTGDLAIKWSNPTYKADLAAAQDPHRAER
jgi:hypothetical protein